MQETNDLTIHGDWQHFLTLPQERMLIVERKHWFIVALPILFTLMLAFFLSVPAFYLFSFFLASLPLFISAIIVLVVLSICFIAKIFIDWYFHLYIVTTRKILEVNYAPLIKHIVNEVWLDQVNCTEADTQINGFISELIDIGNVIMTFDRPTHQEAFVFADIQNPRKIRSFLSANLASSKTNNMRILPLWYKSEEEPKKLKFMEQIFPTPMIEHV